MTEIDFTKLSVHRTAEESPGFLLWRASTSWRRLIESSLKQLDLTHPQFVMLATVGWLTQHGAKTNQVEVGRHAKLDPNTVSQILRSLESKGLIDRVRGSDERSKSPTMTVKGAKLLAQALPAVEAADTQFFAVVDLHKTSAMLALQKLAGY